MFRSRVPDGPEYRVVAGEGPSSERANSELAASLLRSTAPCVLLDGKFVILDASESVRIAIPGVVGRKLSEAFQVEVSALFDAKESSTNARCFGRYASSNGDLVPIILTPLASNPHTDGSRIILINDGAPFRQAEAERFMKVPFVTVRVAPDGVVRLANRPAAAIFGFPSQNALEGKSLESLFIPGDRAKIGLALQNCSDTLSVTPLEATTSTFDNSPGELLQLLFIPDLAPDGNSLGAVLVINSISVERARDTIRHTALNPAIANWAERLRAILKQVNLIVPFEHATFGIYAEDVRLFRAYIIEPEKSLSWPSRWMELPRSIKTWLQEGKTWVVDIKTFVDNDANLRENEVARLYVDHGYLSSVALPTIGTNGPTSALSLCVTGKGRRYGERDLKRLQELDLEPILLRIEADIKADREGFCQDLGDQLAKATLLRDVGQNIVDRVAKKFDWDHLSLFRVNRDKEQFELVYQHASRPEVELPRHYVQPIKEGMLHTTLIRDKVLIVDSPIISKRKLYGYKPTNEYFRSAMTAPIHLNGRVRWIINAEASVTHAFRGPDREAIVDIIAGVEAGLAQRMQREIKSKLLHETQQGVLVVGMEGGILELNDVARRLLGKVPAALEQSMEDSKKLLTDYAANEHSREILLGLRSTTAQRIELLGNDDVIRPVLATRRDFEDTFDVAIWFFTDLESHEWSRESGFLRETVSDVAQQTRAPLILASALAQRALALSKDTEVHTKGRPSSSLPEFIRSLVRFGAEVAKADITFERLAEGLSIQKEPLRKREQVELGSCIQEVVALLPERDQNRVDQKLAGDAILVIGDAGRLAFVIRSIVAYLLRCLPDDNSRVEVAVAREQGRVKLRLRLTPQRPTATRAGPEPVDALWAAVRAAREDASLGLQAIEAVLKAHGGEMSKRAAVRDLPSPSPPWVEFDLMLPI